MYLYITQEMELHTPSSDVRRLGWVTLVTAAVVLLILTAAACDDNLQPCLYCFYQ